MALRDTLQDALYLLSQLNHVISQLDRPWRRALLERTRLSNPIFLGDVLAIISMCSIALRTGTPLPQITPGPLVMRYVSGIMRQQVLMKALGQNQRARLAQRITGIRVRTAIISDGGRCVTSPVRR